MIIRKRPIISWLTDNRDTSSTMQFGVSVIKNKVHYELLFLLLIFSTTFVACDSKDGDWESMKWETNIAITNKKHIVEVSKSGDTYILKCKNYASFWIDALYENGKEFPINPENDGIVKGKWFSVSIEKNIMTVVVLPNHNNSSRYLSIGLTAGDIFDSFSFKQD